MDEQKPVNRKVMFTLWAVILGIIILGTLMIVLVEKNKTTKDITPEDEYIIEATDSEGVLTEEELRQTYTQSLTTLRRDLEVMSVDETKDELISMIEDRLLNIRVPADKRDEYMNAFLTIDKFAKSEAESTETIKAKILELLGSLVPHE